MKSIKIRRIAFVVLIFLALSSQADAQKVQPVSGSQSEQQWEYIVVSYGKTLFESPQKTLAYKTLGLSTGSEATELESALDIMGRFGWEVVTIVGVIGGDQQIVLKRRYDKARAANEYGMILRGRELYLKEFGDIIERSNRLEEEAKQQAETDRSKPRLINLDALDRQAAREKELLALEKSYTEAFQRTELAPISTITVKRKENADFSNDIDIDIRTDLTAQFLKDGNSYRAGDVIAYLRGQIRQYRFRDALLKSGKVKFTVNGFIRFSGTEFVVGKYETSSVFDDHWTRSINGVEGPGFD